MQYFNFVALTLFQVNTSFLYASYSQAQQFIKWKQNFMEKHLSPLPIFVSFLSHRWLSISNWIACSCFALCIVECAKYIIQKKIFNYWIKTRAKSARRKAYTVWNTHCWFMFMHICNRIITYILLYLALLSFSQPVLWIIFLPPAG